MAKVLIVVDMQNDFVTGSLGSPEAVGIVDNVVNKVKECLDDDRYSIVFTKDTHKRDYLDTLEGKYLPVKHCIKDTEGWELIPELRKLLKEKGFDELGFTITKPTFGTFAWDKAFRFCVDLDYIDEFEIIGLCTDICVISNALILRSMFPDSKIKVYADCCAGTTPENHEAALKVMKSCQIIVKGE